MGLATAEFERSGLQEALSWLDRATERAEQLGDEELITLCRSQRAMLHGRSGDIESALTHIRSAHRGLDALQSRDRSVLLLNYGTILLHAGDLGGALERFGESAEVALSHGHVREAFMSRANQGYTAYLSGDLPRALDALSEAEAVQADVSGAVLRLDRGRVLMEAGLLPEALEVLTEAATLAEGEPQRQVLGEIELELARVSVLLGRHGHARSWARRSRDRFGRRASPLWAARAELVLRQLDLLEEVSPRRVLSAAERLTEQLRAGDALLRAEHRLIAAEAALRAGEHDLAAERLGVVERLRHMLPLRAQLQAAGIRARLAIADGQHGQARRVLNAASRQLIHEQAASASTDLRAALTMYAGPLAELHVALTVDRGPRALFSATERWRATGQRVQPVRPPRDPELAGLLVSMRELREQLRDAPPGLDRGPLLRREYELRQRIRARSWAWNGPGEPVQPVGYDHAREVLAREEVDLVSLFGHEDRLIALSVVGGRARVTDVGDRSRLASLAARVRADLDAAGAHELGPFHDHVWGSLRKAMDEIDATLLRPLALGSRRLVVVPQRRLLALPWALAPSLRGVPVVVSASVTDWVRRTDRPAATQVTGPVVRAMAGPDLRLADEEARQVAAAWPGAAAVPSGEGDVASLREAMATSDLVHLAAHGTHHQQSPMFASVQMADGPAYLYDLHHSGVRAQHVVLSSCEVGRSTVLPGDEPLGLASGLLGLGARCVVAGVCRVPDEESAATMTRYHRELASGVSSDEAMARAIEQGGPLAAAFQVAGAAWRAPEPSRS